MSTTNLTVAESVAAAHITSLGYDSFSGLPVDQHVNRINQHAELHTFAFIGLGVIVVKTTSKTAVVVECTIPVFVQTPAVETVDSDPTDDTFFGVADEFLASETISEPIDCGSLVYELDADDLAFAESVDRLNDAIDALTPAGWDCIEPEFPNAWNAPAVDSAPAFAIGERVEAISDGPELFGRIISIDRDSEEASIEWECEPAHTSDCPLCLLDKAPADPLASLADSFVVASDPADWTKSRSSGITSALSARETIPSIDAETARLLDTPCVAVKRLGRNRHEPAARRITSPIRPSRIAVRLARMLALFAVSTSLFTS
jgi:hypothetical protein